MKKVCCYVVTHKSVSGEQITAAFLNPDNAIKCFESECERLKSYEAEIIICESEIIITQRKKRSLLKKYKKEGKKNGKAQH